MVVVKMMVGAEQLRGLTARSGGQWMAERRRRHERESTGSERPGRAHRRRSRGSKLTSEQRAYQAARRRANQRLSFYTHAVAFGSVCAMLIVVAGLRAALIVAMSWGIGLAIHYFVAIVSPRLRGRFIEEEVGRQVKQGVDRERRAIESRNSRSLEHLSASIAHEIRNPITAAKSLVQQMGEDPVSGDNIEYAKIALDELDRVEKSISHLLRYAREEDLRRESFYMADVIGSALDTFRDRFATMGVEITQEVDARGALDGDVEKLRRVLINLVSNALDAMQNAATRAPTLEIQAGENLAGTEVWVRIRDNGPGVDPDTLDKIFSPFYTTKDSGAGLGLALSKKVVDAHGGSIEAHSEPGAGTEFVLTFPKSDRQEA
jgi:signal transduction histidine kinase